MNENYSVTYQYFTKNGRRLAVFCRFLDETTAEIFSLACSKKDQFSRKVAKLIYKYITQGKGKTEDYHPIIEEINIIPEEGTLQTLLSYCKEHYYFPIEVPIAAKDKMIMMAAKEYENDYRPLWNQPINMMDKINYPLILDRKQRKFFTSWFR